LRAQGSRWRRGRRYGHDPKTQRDREAETGEETREGRFHGERLGVRGWP
ncbi:MAG: hypothetical protein RI910_2407, partial [Verrucomicrobiota bacterium]